MFHMAVVPSYFPDRESFEFLSTAPFLYGVCIAMGIY